MSIIKNPKDLLCLQRNSQEIYKRCFIYLRRGIMDYLDAEKLVELVEKRLIVRVEQYIKDSFEEVEHRSKSSMIKEMALFVSSEQKKIKQKQRERKPSHLELIHRD